MKQPIIWCIGGHQAGDVDASDIFDAFDVQGCEASGSTSPASLQDQLGAWCVERPPQALAAGPLDSVEHLRVLIQYLDELRLQRPTAFGLGPLRYEDPSNGVSDESLRIALLTELLPRTTLATLTISDATWLLNRHVQTDARSLASELRKLGAQGVVVIGENAEAVDWLDTPQTSGWLSPQRMKTTPATVHPTVSRFTIAAAAALAQGFCHADAAVLAEMATANGTVPLIGFGLNSDALPGLQATAPAPRALGFSPLSDAWLGLYPVVDSAEWVERVLKAGVRTVQLRIKDASRTDLSQQILRSVRAAAKVNAQLFINDHWQLAIEHGAYGVHLGQEDLQTADLDALRSAGTRLGISSHCYWEVCRAHALRPSYIACGPIHATTTKDMPWWPQGAGNLAYWSNLLRTPVVAIAGMDEARSTEAVRCGAAGVAVLRGITQVGDPEAAITTLSAAVEQGRRWERLLPPALPRSTLEGPVPPMWKLPSTTES
jgi:hydroxymethylpyrimidine kinase/phosphomethylpyrimidine kinase/thiamine-phosphate diphosphorylase